VNNADMPAYPMSEEDSIKWLQGGFQGGSVLAGITKREHFAGLAMQGLCSACDSDGCWTHDAGITATAAIEYADALIAELSKSGE
jgi:hypothetical protein